MNYYSANLLFVLFFVCYVCSETSDGDIMSMVNRFSTKNPYIYHYLYEKFDFPEFRISRVWALYRHGTRFPGKKAIHKYTYNLTELRDKLVETARLSSKEIADFKDWKPKVIEPEHAKYLTKEGDQELLQLGARFRQRFPNLFMNQSQFVFKHSPTQRTEASANKFIEGLFPEDYHKHQAIEVPTDDDILRPYKGCALWKKKVKKNALSLSEKRVFAESFTVDNLINEFRELTQQDNITFKDIELIYTMCGFETAWQYGPNSKSVWCNLFKSEESYKIMEFNEDLQYYWIDGYGHEITRRVACKTVQDIIHQLNPESTNPVNSFYFTHSGTVLKLLVFLDLYKDDFVLTADKYGQNRVWKTSQMDPFASNLAFILFESDSLEPHILFLHQEKIVQLPNCKTNQYGMCSFESFSNIYSKKIEDCNLTKICELKDEL